MPSIEMRTPAVFSVWVKTVEVNWGDEGYAHEELVAELGSAFLAADLGLYLEPREDHASYISSWLAALKNDKRAIFSAASHAQRAVDYLHNQRAKASADIIEKAA